jgi:hypothetical protein
MGGYGQKCEKMPKSLHLNVHVTPVKSDHRAQVIRAQVVPVRCTKKDRGNEKSWMGRHVLGSHVTLGQTLTRST